MSEPPVLYEKAPGGIARITLNRPGVLNAINMEARDLLWSIVLAVRDDPEVRVAIFQGTGDRAFSAGADISEFGTAPSYVQARRARQQRDVWGMMLSVTKPLIAAIHGFAFGAGCELSLLCDLRIASEDATFALPEVTLGYIPSAGGTQTLPRTIAPGLAREMIYSGQPIDATRALAAGLIHRVVPRPRLHEEAESVARTLASMPQAAVRGAKEALLRGEGLPLEQALAIEQSIAARVAAGAER